MLLGCKDEPEQLVSQSPNIIIILADDFGVGDIQAHYPDNKIPTPNLDLLVSEGMSFTDAHSSSAVCSPTRYSLLTGRYNWRTPLQEWVLACYEPPLIREDRTTLPELLKTNGYSTACIGKWHLGWNWPGDQPSERVEERNALRDGTWDFTKPIEGGPLKHGFDYYFGTHVPNFPPFTFIENDKILIQPTAQFKMENYQGMYMPKVFEDNPMAPEWKFQDILPKITERAVQYIHEQSQKDDPFFLFFSMTSPHEPVSPSDSFKGKSGIAPIADFVMETDWSAGELLKAVKEAQISDNTLIIFTADNGHSHYTGWEELLEAGHLASGPYRGHKATIWEGGHRVPFIVKWPGRIAPGSTSDQMVCMTDIYATCNQVIEGQALPLNQAEDSFSMLNVLTGESSYSERSTIVHHSVHGEFAYRNEEWKIVYKLPENTIEDSRGKKSLIELYNLNNDVGEAHDSATFYPDKVEQLTKELQILVERGTSRDGPAQSNDVAVDFLTVQTSRWASQK